MHTYLVHYTTIDDVRIGSGPAFTHFVFAGDLRDAYISLKTQLAGMVILKVEPLPRNPIDNIIVGDSNDILSEAGS